MTIKCTWLFNGQTYANSSTDKADIPRRPFGFSESWYIEGALNSSALYSSCMAWARARAKLMHTGITIVGFRHQEVGAIGKALAYEVNIPGSGGNADLPSHCLEYNCVSVDSSAERKIVLRGVADARCYGGEYNPDQGFERDAKAFFELLEGSWLMRRINQSVQAYPILTVSSGGLVTTKVDVAFAGQSLVQVLRTQTANGKRRGGVYHTQTASAGQTTQLQGWNLGATTDGKIRVYGTGFSQVKIYKEYRDHPQAGNRKVGRPFFQFAGKASKR